MENPNWAEVKGMSQGAAENHMLQNWGKIPEVWCDPCFRDEAMGVIGIAVQSAHAAMVELDQENVQII